MKVPIGRPIITIITPACARGGVEASHSHSSRKPEPRAHALTRGFSCACDGGSHGPARKSRSFPVAWRKRGLAWRLRTHRGSLRPADIRRQVTLMGWVRTRRDHGRLVFLDLWDREGVVQVVADLRSSPDAYAVAQTLRDEYVVAVRGTVNARPRGTVILLCLLARSRWRPMQSRSSIPPSPCLSHR